MKKGLLVILSVIFCTLSAYSLTGKKQVRLRLTDSSNAVYDETNIYLNLGSTSGYLFPEDGQKVIDTSLTPPLIYSFSTDNVPCFSNSFGNFTQTTEIRIGFSVHGPGTYIFSSTLIDNFESTCMLLLEDRLTGVYTDLRLTDYTLTLNQQQKQDDRFFLHISYPAAISTSEALCTNDDGAVHITQDSSIVWNSVILFDNNLNVINSLGNVTGQFNFSGLPEGMYKLVFAYNAYIAIEDIQLNGQQISVTILPTTLQASTFQNILFGTDATNTTNYEWDMGDSSIITGVATADYFYATPGVYRVLVKCTNDYGCVGYDSVTVIISSPLNITKRQEDPFKIFVENKIVQINPYSYFDTKYSADLFNSVGQLLITHTSLTATTRLDLQSYNSGVYLLRIQTERGTFTKRLVLH